MSSLFKTLADEDLKLDKMNLQQPKPRMTGYKVAIFFSFLLSLSAIAGAAFLKYELDGERAQRLNLEASQAQLSLKADSFQKSSEDYKTQLQEIQAQLKAYDVEKQELQKQLESGRAQIEDLKKNLAAVQKEKSELQAKAAAAISEVQQTVSAGPAAAAAAVSTAAKAAPAVQAAKAPQILTVNRKFNFAVVNIGLQQKLKIGDVLEVIRKGQPVGRLQVEKLYESFSAASIVKEPKEAPFQEGDLVRPAV